MLSISRHGTLEGDQSSDALRTELLEKKGRRISKPEAGPCTLSPSAFQVHSWFVRCKSLDAQADPHRNGRLKPKKNGIWDRDYSECGSVGVS